MRQSYLRSAGVSARTTVIADPDSESTPPLFRGGLHKFSPVESERPPPDPVDGPWIKDSQGRTIHWTEREREDQKTREASRARNEDILARSKAKALEAFRKRVEERLKNERG